MSEAASYLSASWKTCLVQAREQRGVRSGRGQCCGLRPRQQSAVAAAHAPHPRPPHGTAPTHLQGVLGLQLHGAVVKQVEQVGPEGGRCLSHRNLRMSGKHKKGAQVAVGQAGIHRQLPCTAADSPARTGAAAVADAPRARPRTPQAAL